MKKEDLFIFLEKYEHGTCTSEELAALNAWYTSFSDQERTLEDDLKRHPQLLKTLKLQLWNGIEDQISFELEPLGSPRLSGAPSWILRIAAVIVFGFLAGLAYWKLQPVADSSEFHTVSTQKNNLSKIKLSDGTIIWVKSGSNLRYPEQFGISSREVFLDGEAFFDVSHQEGKPFLVHTSDLTIRVLGTSFNVKSYKDQGTIETTLIKGKIKIEKEKENVAETGEIILNPNEKAVYNKESRLLNILKSVDVAAVLISEKDAPVSAPVLVFDETPFTKVFAQLEQHYQVKIHINDKENLNCKLTADLQKEGLIETLKLLEVSHQIHYRISGNDVYITGKLCH